MDIHAVVSRNPEVVGGDNVPGSRRDRRPHSGRRLRRLNSDDVPSGEERVEGLSGGSVAVRIESLPLMAEPGFDLGIRFRRLGLCLSRSLYEALQRGRCGVRK